MRARDLDGRRRVVIARVGPGGEFGRFASKATSDQPVIVEADVFADGHDELAAILRYRRAGAGDWSEVPMAPLGNDRWRASFTAPELGKWEFTIEAWVDRFRTLRRDLRTKVRAGQDVGVDLLGGASLLRAAAARAEGADAEELRMLAGALADEEVGAGRRVELALAERMGELVDRWPDRSLATEYGAIHRVQVERPKARSSAWYERFPRSCGAAGRHGSFKDCEALLPSIAAMGFDVLYLPPIHPIGRTHRKGPNNAAVAGPEDVGSPWAIGSEEGGHTAVHPRLGTLDDLRSLRAKAEEVGLELALDLAFQCSPDHPWVREHPEWFRHRADGSVQYAENPPKRYEDIYPLDFESTDWRGLWEALAGVVDFWLDQGIRIFRVDNPHTKPFAFWEWLIARVHERYPDVIFLAEAFTRPAVMYRLAKLGFSQSYTYFAWRNTAPEIRDYMEELTQSEVAGFFRPNLWPNTPDILTEHLQVGGRPAFLVRLILAGTLGASYGIYGPALELMEARALRPGSEEYLDSEKYQLREWPEPAGGGSLVPVVTLLNRIRRENVALQSNHTLRFHPTTNEQLLCFSKHGGAGADVIVVVANLDPHYTQSGWVELDLEYLGIDPALPFQVHDLLGQGRYLWHGGRNFVELDPRAMPAQIFRVRHRVRTERDFEYFL